MLTIVIPTYNRGDILIEKLDEIITNSLGANILILDNCSTIKTREYQELNQRVKDLESVTYVRNEVNIYMSGSIYKALEMLKTEYALILSDEDIPVPNVSGLFREFIEKNGSFLAIRPSIISPIEGVIYAEYPDKIFDEFKGVSEFGLTGNYISGQIYNAHLMREKNIINKARDASYMIPDYTHLLMNMLCAAVGRTAFVSTAYVQQKDTAYTEPLEDPDSDPSFYTGARSYAMRYSQFLGLRDGLKMAHGGEINQENADSFYTGYLMLCNKYAHLLILVQYQTFLKKNMHPKLIAESFYYFAMASICNLPYADKASAQIAERLKTTLNHFLKQIGAEMIS